MPFTKRAMMRASAAACLLGALILSATPASAAARPDGLIAFVNVTYTTDTIRTIDPATGIQKSLFQGTNPAWSPDGTHLAYISEKGKIVIRNGPGSFTYTGIDATPFNLAGASLDWSPNGTKLVFTRIKTIWVMNATAPYHPHEIFSSFALSPMWSGDGTKIVFTGQDNNLHVINANGSNDHNISTAPEAQFSPAWSPDGATIAFCAPTASTPGLYAVNPNGTNERLITNLGCDTPAWSPDSSQVTYQTNDGGLGVVNANGSNPHEIVSDFFETNPTWGP